MQLKNLYLYVITAVLLINLNACQLVAYKTILNAKIESSPAEQKIATDNQYSSIFVPVEINGKTYRFLFDTGSQTTVVSTAIAKDNRIKKIGKLRVTDSQETKSKLIASKLKELRFGDAIFKNVGVVVHDFKAHDAFECLPIDGIIGMNILKHYQWKLDFSTNTLALMDSTHVLETIDAIPVDISYKRNRIHTQLFVGTQPTNFLFDTGNNGKKITLSKLQNSIKIKETVGFHTFGIFGETQIDTSSYFVEDLTDSALFSLENVTFSLQKEKKPNIGAGFLQDNFTAFAVDRKKEKLYLWPKNPAAKRIYDYPFAAILSSKALIVAVVDKDFQTLKIGDTITAVNHINVSTDSICEALHTIREHRRNQRPLQLQIKREGKNYTYQIEGSFLKKE